MVCEFSFVVVLCVLQIDFVQNEPLWDPYRNFDKKTINISPRILTERAEILNEINNVYDEESHDDAGTSRISLDYIAGRVKKATPFMKLMKLIQKNYDAYQKNRNDERNTIRIYYISNPEVLDEYKKSFRAGSTSSSSGDSDYGKEERRIEDRMLKSFLEGQRRNSMSRIAENNSEEIKDYHEKSSNNVASIKVDEKSNDVKNDVWDVITQKYDWSKSKEDSGHEDPKKDDSGDLADKEEKKFDQDIDKKSEKGLDEKTTEKERREREDKWESSKKIGSWEKIDKKKELKWNDVSREWGSKVTKWNSDNNWDKPMKSKNTDKWASSIDTRHKEDFKRDREETKPDHDTWDKPKIVFDDDKDEQTVNWEKDWAMPLIKAAVDSAGKKKDKKWNNGPETFKSKRNWYKPKTDENRNMNLNKVKNTINNSKNKKSKPIVHDWDSYEPKKEKRWRNMESGNSNFHALGRTPIPFIGKKGIYDDK